MMGVSVRPLLLVGTLLLCVFTDLGKANQDECGCDMACSDDTCEDCFANADFDCDTDTVECPDGMHSCGKYVCVDEQFEYCTEGTSCLTSNTCGSADIATCPNDVVVPVTDENDNASVSWTPPFNPNSTQFISVIFTCLGPGHSVYCLQDGYGEFPAGITWVMYTTTETAGLVRTCNFTVTVVVAELSCPENVTTSAIPGETEIVVTWDERDLSRFDVESNSFNRSNSPGELFKIGTHQITYELNLYGHNSDCHFFVTVEGLCPAESLPDANFGVLNWPATLAGTTTGSSETCPLMTTRGILGEPKGLRNCAVAAAPVYFRWENHTSELCGEPIVNITLNDVKKTQVTEDNAPDVAEFLANATLEAQEQNTEIQVDTVATILENIVNANTGDSEVTQSVVEAVNSVIQNSEDSEELSDNAASSSAIVRSVQSQVTLTLQEEGQVSIAQDSLHVEAISRNFSEIRNGLTFASVRDQAGPQQENNDGRLQGSSIQTSVDAGVDADVLGSIQIPGSVFELDNNLGTDDNTQLRAGFIIYANDALFQSASLQKNNSDENTLVQVAGPVLSLFIEGVTLRDLQEPLVLTFKAPANVTEETLASTECVSWDFSLEDGVGDWSQEGCNYTGMKTDTVACECNHATNFAVLMNFGQNDHHPAAERALELISQIGIALSITALIITLAAYLAIRKLRTGISRQIFIHFCVSLLLLYVVFLVGVDNAVSSEVGCVFVSALLHYLVLSTMMWMAVEARNMYVSTVKVFPEDTQRYMLKACIIAWGSPLLVVAITVAAATDHYGTKNYCFVSPSLTMYLGLLLPIGLVLAHNIVTFIMVMRSLLKVQEESRSQKISKRLQNAIGISALMGLTWVFGFLAIGSLTFAFQLIFCLANSLQGVIIFIMFVLRREEVRTAVAPYFAWMLCCGQCRTKPSAARTEDIGLTSTTGGSSKITSVSNTVSGNENTYCDTAHIYETTMKVE